MQFCTIPVSLHLRYWKWALALLQEYCDVFFDIHYPMYSWKVLLVGITGFSKMAESLLDQIPEM